MSIHHKLLTVTQLIQCVILRISQERALSCGLLSDKIIDASVRKLGHLVSYLGQVDTRQVAAESPLIEHDSNNDQS